MHLAIKTDTGFQRLLADPKFILTKGKVTTAEVFDDMGRGDLRALERAAGGEAVFLIGEREARCAVSLTATPELAPKKVAFRRLTLTELPS